MTKAFWWFLLIGLAAYGWLYHLSEAESIYARTRT